MSLLKHIYKIAVKVPNWMPQWVKDHPDIKKSPDKIEKTFPFNDFRLEVTDLIDLKDSAIERLARSIREELNSLLFDLEPENKARELLKEFQANFGDNFTDIKKIQECIKTNKIKIKNQEHKFFKTLQKLNIKIETLDGFGDFSKSGLSENNKTFLVFSTDTTDILRMSSSSDWSSCQNIDNGAYKEFTISTAIYNYIGIMYLTNSKDFNNTGEKILYRSIIRMVTNEDTNEDAVVISRIYPQESTEIFNLFKHSLKAFGNGIKVLDKNSLTKKWKQKVDYNDIQYDYSSYEEPKIEKPESFENHSSLKEIFDINEIIKLLSNKNLSDFFFNKFTTQYIQYKSAHNRESLFDPFDIVKATIFDNANNNEAKKLYNEFLKQYKRFALDKKYSEIYDH